MLQCRSAIASLRQAWTACFLLCIKGNAAESNKLKKFIRILIKERWLQKFPVPSTFDDKGIN